MTLAELVEDSEGSCVWLLVLEEVEVAVALASEGLAVPEGERLPLGAALPEALALSVDVRVSVWLAVPVLVRLPQAEAVREKVLLALPGPAPTPPMVGVRALVSVREPLAHRVGEAQGVALRHCVTEVV